MFQQNSFSLIKIGRLLWLAFFLCVSANAQQLQLNQPVTGEIKKDESQIFKISVKKDEFVRLVVWQKTADVGLKFFSAKNEVLIETDNSNSTEEPERLSFIANETGEYRIEIKAVGIWKTPGTFEIKLEALRPLIAKDKNQVEAEKLYNQAIFYAWFSKELNAKQLAVETFNKSLPIFQNAQDRFGEACVYYYLGILYYRLANIQKSTESSAKSAQIFREIKALPILAMVLSNEAAVQARLENLERAEKLWQEALEIYRQLDDKKGIAKIGGNLALIVSGRGQASEALKIFEEILPIFQAENDRSQEAWALHSIGSIYDDLGNSTKAVEFLEKALNIRRELGDTENQANTLVNLASALKSLSEHLKAIENLKKALEIYLKLGNEINQTFCLNNLGANYDDLGDYLQAIDYYEKSLQINRKYKLRENEAGNLNNLAIVSIKLGDFDKALEFQTKALEIFRETKNRANEMIAMVNLGVILQRKGNHAKALEFFQATLSIFREAKLPDWEAQVLFHIGEVQLYSGEFQKSYENCSNSLEINQQIKNRNGEMVALLCAAKAENKIGRLAEAQTKIEKALMLIEDLRTRIVRQDLQANYFSSRQDFYEFYLDLLMQRHKLEPTKGFDALALQTVERARARNLLESIGQTELREGVSPELLAQEKGLRQKINRLETSRQQLISSKASKEKLAEIEKAIDESLRELRDIWAKIRVSNPKLADFSQATPLNLSEIQKQVLDDESVLVEYSLGAERSFLFVVTKKSLKSVELPKRAEIEILARNFYDNLKSRAKKIPNETDAQRQTRLQKSDAERQKNARALSKILLAPIAKEIENKRLLIVASEVLQFIPFAALQIPNSDAKQSEVRYLIEANEVVNLPSASALATLRKTQLQSSTKDIAIFADPVFSGDDARLPLGVSAFRSDYIRLDFSRDEAEKIASFAPNEKRLLALDYQASLQNLRSQDLQQFRYLHFATHGILDSRFPELSGLVLSLVDEKGNPQEGFLRLSEIYNLKLNAKMAVLSACETGLGNYFKGEGLVGFTHAFMYAGAQSVVASLWRVDDYATSELMQRFYQARLKEGLPPAKALQKAQISMIKEKALNNPFHWSAFTLQGEWR